MKDGGPDTIDVATALEMRRAPLYKRWGEIGGVLAYLDGRAVPYLGVSVANKVNRAVKNHD